MLKKIVICLVLISCSKFVVKDNVINKIFEDNIVKSMIKDFFDDKNELYSFKFSKFLKSDKYLSFDNESKKQILASVW